MGALELAKDAVKQTPGRGGAWLTLALAHYRNGNWAAAEKAEEQAINISTEGQAVGYHRVMMAMIRWQQGRKTTGASSSERRMIGSVTPNGCTNTCIAWLPKRTS